MTDFQHSCSSCVSICLFVYLHHTDVFSSCFLRYSTGSQRPKTLLGLFACSSHARGRFSALLTHWDEMDNGEINNDKKAILLVCGHILCEDCWRELVKQWHHRPDGQHNTPPRCPYCREQLRFEQCGHIMRRTLYVNTEVDKHTWLALPPTMTEEGRKKPQKCNACHGEQLRFCRKCSKRYRTQRQGCGRSH
ncbi:hypothetical protein N656DRAFT_405127 [Canariomyces notabilis]|uniref:RING-type domain-containing protein n=1 Tax=Canariomyces notabilis TaxID=2074819 RepID=A0AAN6TL03_9PEZI|nr:hypothetical protein N656DRAFT_405127 [Canariomyces arenarius]